MLSQTKSFMGLRYSRAMEHRADAEGLHLMARAGFLPEAPGNFFEMLAKEEGKMTSTFAFLSDHPPSRDRVIELRALEKKLNLYVEAQESPLPAEDDWEEVRRRAQKKGSDS